MKGNEEITISRMAQILAALLIHSLRGRELADDSLDSPVGGRTPINLDVELGFHANLCQTGLPETLMVTGAVMEPLTGRPIPIFVRRPAKLK